MDASAAAQEAISKAKGRKDKDGQPAVMDTAKLKELIEDGAELKTKADTANEKYADWVKATAEKCGILASVVRKAVNARVKDDWEEQSRRADQMKLVFDDCAED